MRTRILSLTALVIIFLPWSLACGGGSAPSAPDITRASETQTASRQLWGLWKVDVIPDGQGSAELVFAPLRSPQVHLNVVGLLESGSGVSVGIDPPVTLVGGILDVDIRLTHPFDPLKLTGFDVRGILIGHGSMAGFTHTLFYAGPNDIEILNADGHSRLWNPTEYTGSGYVDGKLGKPDALENYTATLNGYKYFADGLTADMPVSDMPKADRGAFRAGSSNVRHYTIRLGDKGLTFQYAIDANWWKPTDPVEVPDSFDIERANCPEPYYIDAVIGPGIHGGGGSAAVTVDIYDWQKDIDAVYMEAPLLTGDLITLTGPDDMGDFLRFTGALTNGNLPAGDFADVLIYAQGSDPDSGTTYTDYRLFRLPLTRVPVGGVVITIQDDMAYKTIGVEYHYSGDEYDWGAGNPAPVDYSDSDGPWDFTRIPDVTGGTRKALAKDDPEVASFSGEFNAVVTHLWRTQWVMASDTSQVYQAEVHSESANLLRMWGVYEESFLEGAMPLDPPIDFPYPMDIDTHYLVSKTYTVIPVLLTLTISFERWGIGEGVAFVPVEPGLYGWGWEAQAALGTRTIATIETGGMLGQGVLGTGLVYEWIADDGTTYGSIMSGNSPDGDPNFDDGTYEIIGTGTAQGLRSIT